MAINLIYSNQLSHWPPQSAWINANLTQTQPKRKADEIDIDSDRTAAFQESDRRLVEFAAGLLGARWETQQWHKVQSQTREKERWHP